MIDAIADSWLAPLLIIVVSAMLIIVVVLIADNHRKEWDAWCVAQNGHVVSKSDLHTGVGYAFPVSGGSGGVVVTTSSSTTYFCLSPSGGILGID